MMAAAVARIMADPMPWTARQAIIWNMFWARDSKTNGTVNTRIPRRYVRSLPRKSATQPIVRSRLVLVRR